MAHHADLESLAREAVAGNRDALDELIRSVQGDVYGLVIRMLWNREDASGRGSIASASTTSWT